MYMYVHVCTCMYRCEDYWLYLIGSLEKGLSLLERYRERMYLQTPRISLVECELSPGASEQNTGYDGGYF